MSGEDRDVLAEIIGQHSWDMTDEIKVDGAWTWVLCCECGETPPIAEGHQHIADAVLASDWLAEYVATKQAEALREAARYFEYEMATAWGRDATWISTGSRVADLVADNLRDRADRIAP